MANSYTANRRFLNQEIASNDSTWGDNLNANWERTDNILGDTTAKATTGGDTALTDDEQDVAIITTSGTLASNATVTFDGRRGYWIVYNGNTGAYTTTFLVSGQTGVAVNQSAYALLYYNGTDLVNAAFTSDLVADLSPQLGANLDTNAFNILFDDATGLLDDSSNEQLIFQKTASAVNHWEMTNAATGAAPLLQAVGGDTDIPAKISGKGTGQVQFAIDGTNEVILTATALSPATSAGNALGTASLMWSDAFFASGGVLNFDNGDVTLTHSSNALTLGGGGFYMADNILSRPEMIDYSESVNAIGSIGGGTQDIDLTLGNVVSGTVDTSTTTFTFSNPIATGCSSFTLILTNGGSQTVNWPAGVDWPSATAPTLTTSGVDVLTFFTVDAGTTWYGFAAGTGMG